MVSIRVAVFVACLALVCVQVQAKVTSQWSYYRQEKWGGVCSSGSRQSPIDINFLDGSVVYDHSLQPVAFSGFGALPRKAITVSNNGQTLVGAVSPKAKLQVAGGPFRVPYTIAQLNLHWGREDTYGADHTVNGNRFPLELHLVGYRGNSLKAALASKSPSALTELAVLFALGAPNPAIQSLIEASDNLLAGDRAAVKTVLNMADLLPSAASTEFVTYDGSLASPPCSENVRWVVFRNVLTVSSEQLASLRKLLTAKGKRLQSTFRFVQPVNQRQVRSSFPFVVRRPVLTIANTPLGHVGVNVNTVTAPAQGAPVLRPGLNAVPVVDAAPAKVPVREITVPATEHAGAGSTSTTINVSPLTNDPKGPQKVDSVVRTRSANIPRAKLVPVQLVGSGGCPECVVVTKYADSPAQFAALQKSEDAKFNAAHVAEADIALIETAASADPAAAPAEAAVPQIRSASIKTGSAASTTAKYERLAKKLVTLPIHPGLTHRSVIPPPRLATVLNQDINAHVDTTTDEMREQQKELKKTLAKEARKLNDVAFDSHAVVHPPLIPPNTVEATYAKAAWSNNQHPIVTGVDKGTYMHPGRSRMFGKLAPRVTSFHPSLDLYHETETREEPVPEQKGLPFELPPVEKVLHKTPYEVQSTITSTPDPTAPYVVPTGPLTRGAGSTMLPQSQYPSKNYKPISQKGYRGFDWVAALPPRDTFVSASFIDTAVALDGAFPGSATHAVAEDMSAEHAKLFEAEGKHKAALAEVRAKADQAHDAASLMEAYNTINSQLSALHPHVVRLAAFQNRHLGHAATYASVVPAVATHIHVVQAAREKFVRSELESVVAKLTQLEAVETRAESLRKEIGSDMLALMKARTALGQARMYAFDQVKTLGDAVSAIARIREDDARQAAKSAKSKGKATSSRDVAMLAKELHQVKLERSSEGQRLQKLTKLKSKLTKAAAKAALLESESEASTPSAGHAHASGSLDASLNDLLAQVHKNSEEVAAAAADEPSVSLVEVLSSLKTLHSAQEGALAAQQQRVSALQRSANRMAASTETAKLAQMKADHASTLEAESSALSELEQLKEQNEAQRKEIAAQKASLAEVSAKLAKAAAENAQHQDLSTQKALIESKMTALVAKSRQIRDVARRLRDKQAVRVRQAIKKAVGSSGAALVETASKSQDTSAWKAEVADVQNKIEQTLAELRASGVSESELYELEHTA